MKEYYYYLRDEEGLPIVTVCLLKDGECISRGLSLYKREPKHHCTKKYGRKKARTRAIQAMEKGTDTEWTNIFEIQICKKIERNPLKKSDDNNMLAFVSIKKSAELAINEEIVRKDSTTIGLNQVNPKLTSYESKLLNGYQNRKDP